MAIRPTLILVRVEGIEPPLHKKLVPKTSASTNSATPAITLPTVKNKLFGGLVDMERLSIAYDFSICIGELPIKMKKT